MATGKPNHRRSGCAAEGDVFPWPETASVIGLHQGILGTSNFQRVATDTVQFFWTTLVSPLVLLCHSLPHAGSDTEHKQSGR